MTRSKKTRPPAISDAATQYALEVVAGERIAGPHVRGQCARHLRDIESGHKRGLVWKVEESEKAQGFYADVLKLNGGDFEGKPFELLPWQKFVVGSLFGWQGIDGYRRFRVAYVETAKGSGKSPLAAGIGMKGLVADNEARAEVYSAAPLALDTLVPTPCGWKTQGDLVVGDCVFDENGKPCNVTYLSPILENKECFEVVFDDGTIVVSDANHRWQTVDTRGQSPTHYPPKVVTTAQIANTLRSSFGALRHRISVAGALDMPTSELPIDPYTLGVWLGDGRANRGAICYHKDDIQHLAHIRAAGYEVSEMGSQNDTRYGTILGLRTQLKALGLLDNKHVPDVYLRADAEQRRQLLAGLMDTDGTCTKTGECRFTNRERRLVEAAHELATGLGIRASFREIEVTGAPYWCVSFKAPKSLRVFNLDRKFVRQRERVDTRATGRYICDVRPCASVPVRCIEVDSENHLYLVTRSHIATHNTKKDQAMILFRDAVAMVDQSPELSKRLQKSGTGERCWNLAYMAQGAFFRPISSDDGQSGPRPHIGLIDELHEHKTNTVVEMMRAGTKSRRQAMIFMITNAGHNRMGPCWGYHEYGAKVAAGEVEDDAFFPYVCSLDEQDDPFADESCWPKANPSLQDADLPGVKYIREQVVEAKGMPSKEAIVRRLNFCQWTDAESPWISGEVWRGAQRDFDWQDLRGRRAVAGLDLSSTTDLTGMVFLVEPIEAGEPWLLVPFAWLPDVELQRKADTDRVPYIQWRAEGYLDTTPGRAISKRVILQKLSAMCDFFEIVAVGYDRWRIEDLMAMAADDGISLPEMKPVGQGYKDFSPALETFERMLLNGEIAHAGHKVLDWCMSNAVIEQDGAENRKLSKEKATGRIDLAVAAVMASGLINTTLSTEKSFWEAS